MDSFRQFASAIRNQVRQNSHLTDVEKQQLEQENRRKAQRARLLHAMFGVDSSELTRMSWCGIESYMDYLEEQMSQTERKRLTSITNALKLSPGNDRVEDGFELLATVAECFRKADAAYDPKEKHREFWWSVDDLRERLYTELGFDPEEENETSDRRALFSAVSWLTTTVEPAWTMEEGIVAQLPKRNGENQISRIQNCQRPFSGMLSTFGPVMPLYRPNQDYQDLKSVSAAQMNLNRPESLYASSLNFNCLQNVGRMTIEWTNLIGQHLEFDPLSRKLSLYRFPSYIGLELAQQKDPSSFLLFNRILHRYYQHMSASDRDPIDAEFVFQLFRREVLLSYRILFGQDYASRKHFHRYEVPKLEALARANTESCKKNTYDHFLDILCGENTGKTINSLPKCFWPESCLNLDGDLQEQEVYSMDVDFPVLGQRLAKVQAFCGRQQPRRIRDLWRDTRNPLQWYTFWAVIIVGGVSIILQVLALILAGIQTYAQFVYG